MPSNIRRTAQRIMKGENVRRLAFADVCNYFHLEFVITAPDGSRQRVPVDELGRYIRERRNNSDNSIEVLALFMNCDPRTLCDIEDNTARDSVMSNCLVMLRALDLHYSLAPTGCSWDEYILQQLPDD